MKALRLIAVAALAVAASAQSFANSYVLGTLTVPSLAPPVIADHNGLAINATFTDTYSFSFTAPAPGGATTTGVLIDYTQRHADPDAERRHFAFHVLVHPAALGQLLPVGRR